MSAGITGAEVGRYWESSGGECDVVSGITTQAGGFDGFRVARHGCYYEDWGMDWM